MTDQQTPREAIENVAETIEWVEKDGLPEAIYVAEAAIDTYNRHIWDRAMSDEVVTVMVNRLDPYGIYTNDPVYQARWATSIIRTALAAVIGPKPGEKS